MDIELMENEISECRRFLNKTEYDYKVFLDKSETINSNKEFICFQFLLDRKSNIDYFKNILLLTKEINKSILIYYNTDF